MLGPAQDHVFLIMEVRRPPLTTYMHKGSLEAKGELCQGVFYPDTFSVKFVFTYVRILRYTKYGL